ncbi:hypothetical protein V865_000475 [Kwoniella europaea PYCC6329]|uniref:Uncharacterized protein n=1 Tax=Kwoniella europaea PYCC6329 TaxID=1423913 RepID=A0AAX4K7G9_9TREE
MHSEEQQHDDLVASPPTHTTPVFSQEDFHPEMSSSNSIPHNQSTPCDPPPPQSTITNPSSSSNTTILVGDTTINDIVRSSIPACDTNKHNKDDDHDIAGNISHATPSVADLTDELTICRSRISDLEKSNKALKSENEEYRESLKYQSEEIKLLRKTYPPNASTEQSPRYHREDGCSDGWEMNPFEEYNEVMGWGGKNVDQHKENLQKIIIFDDPPQELIYETDKSQERSSENDLASIKVKILKRDIHNLKMRVEMLQREQNEKYWKDTTSPYKEEEEVSEAREEGEDDGPASNYFDDQHDYANDSLRLEQALLQEKQDHLRTLSKIEEIVHLKDKEIRELNDKLLDQQGLAAEMLDTNGILTQRISELEKQLEDDHRLRMEERSNDVKRFQEERFTGEVRAGVAGRTSEVFDAGLTDVFEVEKGSQPKYYGW